MKKQTKTPANVMVMGVGAAAVAVMKYMCKTSAINPSRMVACVIDRHYINKNSPMNYIAIGNEALGEFGACNCSHWGRDAALESIHAIKRLFIERKVSFLILFTALGGGTGTGASPVIIEAAQSLGVHTTALVTLPFAIEGGLRRGEANNGVDGINRHSNHTLVVDNENLKFLSDEGTIAKFQKLDNLLSDAIEAIFRGVVLANLRGEKLRDTDIYPLLYDAGFEVNKQQPISESALFITAKNAL